ncbi:EamA/RhaT family transporter [Gordonia rubripertincta]|uniref:EamA/RhaT family transporter n=1 Tax=Gordonia rubripertincta TaxID=36822 RepID=UPI00117EFBF4|nr:EamA/RhaT family transporter [Gordonia rubripertincta]QMU21926.1 EamA/RhaT family transporter [Gordonia rubripertincta]TSD95768.1 EamA/RhaT family transporter [Gordonia rubripertincta]
MTSGIVIAVIGALAFAAAAVLQALGAEQVSQRAAIREERRRSAAAHPSLKSTALTMLTVPFLIGFVFDIIGFIATIASARLIPLFLSQTIISARLVATALLAMAVLKVGLTMRDWIAGAVVVASLILLAVSAGREGVEHTTWMHWAVLVAGPAMVVLGLIVMRRLKTHIATVTGLIAGAVFGVMAVASRILDGLDPLDLTVLFTDPALYGLLLSGIGGFYLFTVALQTGSVNGAAAALVVGQTVLPGAVGIAFLGDVTRAGWGPAAIVAFVAAVGGGVVLASSGAVTAVETADATNAPRGYGHPPRELGRPH